MFRWVFWVKTSSAHYQGAVLLMKSMFVFIFIHTQSTNGYLFMYLEIDKIPRACLYYSGVNTTVPVIAHV